MTGYPPVGEVMIKELFPILATSDIERALRFYRDLLGGVVTYEFGGPDGQPAYLGLRLGESHLGIGLETERLAVAHRAISLWVYTDDCNAAIARMRGAGVTITGEPTDEPWCERVGRVLDPHGNELIVGQKVSPP